MFTQKERRYCREVICENYPDTPLLMADRKGAGGYYYSVWHVGDHLLEATITGETLEIFDYVSAK